ncbi:MAG: hypothetical protein MI866_02760 [Bacteroidales bacterium]|nr:hypothetical protein [Bacteroidales bacterium]
MKEYKFSNKLKLLTYIVAPILIGGFGYIGFIPFLKDYGLTGKLFLLGLSFILIFAAIMSIIEAVKTKLVIKDKQFIKTRIFSIRILRFDEIKGFRIDENYTYLIPNNDKKAIIVTKYFSDTYELRNFLTSNFKDLDKADKKKEVKNLLTNKKYGRNKNEIITQIEEIQKITRPLNWIALVLALALWFYPKFYELLTILNIVIPIIALGIIVKSKGLVHVLSDDDSPHPTLNSALSMPPLVLLIRAITDYDIFSYLNVWLPIIILTSGIMYLLIKYSEDEFKGESKTEKLIIYPFYSIAIGIFMFALVIQLNCTFDNRPYETYESSIISKKISESKNSKTYKINIADWNGKGKKTEVRVTRNQYSKLKENDKIEIILRPGLFDIPWYHIRIN